MGTDRQPEVARRKRPSVRVPALALLGAVAAGSAVMLAVVRGSASDPPAPRPQAPAAAVQAPQVIVERVSPRAFAHSIRVTGSLKSDEVVALSTKATGLVRQVLAKEGDRVRRGQLLVQIDDRELQAQRDRAWATVQAAEARLKQALTSRGVKNAAVSADYRRAQQTLSAARSKVSQTRALAGIAATEVVSDVETARARLQAARERLKILQEGSRSQEKLTAELAVARAQAQVNKLKSNLQRREQLLAEGAIAREAVDNARSDYESALAELNSARAQADLVSEGPRSAEVRAAAEEVRQAEAALRSAEANRARRQVSDEDVEAAQAQLRQAEAGLDSARAALAQRQWNADEIRSAQAALAQARADVRYYDQLIAQTRVYSPVNGVVSQRKMHVGESISPTNNQVMTLVATDTLYFEATAPESALPYLRVGGPAEVTLDALPGETLAGRIREIIPVAEGSSRSVRLRISVPRPKADTAVVGGFARATLRGETRRPVLTMPRAALLSDDGETAVYVVENGRATSRPVRVGATNADRVEVRDGLRAGERVVVDGASALTDGQTVKEVIRNAEAR